jgi:hypothetical protein
MYFRYRLIPPITPQKGHKYFSFSKKVDRSSLFPKTKVLSICVLSKEYYELKHETGVFRYIFIQYIFSGGEQAVQVKSHRRRKKDKILHTGVLCPA